MSKLWASSANIVPSICFGGRLPDPGSCGAPVQASSRHHRIPSSAPGVGAPPDQTQIRLGFRPRINSSAVTEPSSLPPSVSSLGASGCRGFPGLEWRAQWVRHASHEMRVSLWKSMDAVSPCSGRTQIVWRRSARRRRHPLRWSPPTSATQRPQGFLPARLKQCEVGTHSAVVRLTTHRAPFCIVSRLPTPQLTHV